MAKKEQCIACKGYNQNSDLCTIKWEQPLFDGSTCDKFSDFEKEQRPVKSVTQEEVHTETTGEASRQKRVVKRGRSSTKNVIHYEGAEKTIQDETLDENESSDYVLEIPEHVIRYTGLFLIFIVMVGIGYWSYTYIQQQEEQKREDLVWKAKQEIEKIRSAKFIDYLRINRIEYADQQLNLSFIRNEKYMLQEEKISESTMYKELRSLVAIFPNEWDSICHYLALANVDLHVRYVNFPGNAGITLLSKDLQDSLLTQDCKQEGLLVFSQLKRMEIKHYADIHFRRDRFFSVDSVSVDKQYVILNLSYDNTKATLGKSFTDTVRINPHFTDPVGELGSILDGILQICTRTNKGFGFAYVGQKSRDKYLCLWDVDRMKEIAKLNSNTLVIGRRKTNQVRTVIQRTK